MDHSSLIICNFPDDAISKREEALDYIVPLPHVLPGASVQLYDGTFPELNASLLEGLEMQSPLPSPWKQRHRRLRPKNLDVSTLQIRKVDFIKTRNFFRR